MHIRPLLTPCLLALLLACDPAAPPDAGEPMDAGALPRDATLSDAALPDADVRPRDAAIPDASATMPLDPCSGFGATFEFVGLLPRPARDAHAIVVGDRLHVFPGADERGASDETWSAQIDADGRPGEFTRGPSLPQAMYASGAPVDVDGRLFLIGGHADGERRRSYYVREAAVRPDGFVGEWTTQTLLPFAGRSFAAVLPWRDGIAVFGGETAEKGSGDSSFETGAFDADGRLEWTHHDVYLPLSPFPLGAAVVGAHLFVGDHSNLARASATSLEVWERMPGPGLRPIVARGRWLIGVNQFNLVQAWVADDGSVGRPEVIAPLPVPFASYGGGIAVTDTHVYRVGGQFGSPDIHDEIWAARLCDYDD